MSDAEQSIMRSTNCFIDDSIVIILESVIESSRAFKRESKKELSLGVKISLDPKMCRRSGELSDKNPWIDLGGFPESQRVSTCQKKLCFLSTNN